MATLISGDPCRCPDQATSSDFTLSVFQSCSASFGSVSQFAMIIFNEPTAKGRRPLHILIVVVGNDSRVPLHNAQAFCQRICDFWVGHDDNALSHQMSLSSINLLASDAAQPNHAVTVRAAGKIFTVDNPSCTNVSRAVQEWCDLVAKNGAGIIHWIGHGHHRMQEGGSGVQILFTDDLLGNGDRNGIHWSCTIHGIDDRTKGNPVFCFVDCCRLVDINDNDYYPTAFVGRVPSHKKHAAVVYSAAPDNHAFWDDARHVGDRAAQLEFEGGPVATAAFLKTFEGVGADYILGRGLHDVRMNGIAEGARGLVCRWMHAIGTPIEKFEANVDVSCPGRFEVMIHSSTPQSVLDIFSPDADTCSLISPAIARPADGVMVPLSRPSKFEFIVPRGGNYNAQVRDPQGDYNRPLGETISVPHQQVEVSR